MDITVNELKEKLDRNENFIFIDVREPDEYAEFNLGAILRPLGTVSHIVDEFADHKNDEIVIHCRSGARSGVAKDFLIANGFKNVRNLLGGVLAWKNTFG
ncbi:MAG: rhodanese-like domain-containing protein [Saprospiraceae bacterium]|jgi:rhodanese-related sulfurtransferase|nr:rhodanese-like domain-containing protein [Saprospiraceae bacterium]